MKLSLSVLVGLAALATATPEAIFKRQDGSNCVAEGPDKVTGNQCAGVIDSLNARDGETLHLDVSNGCDNSLCASDCAISVCPYGGDGTMDLPASDLISDVNEIMDKCSEDGDTEFIGRFQAVEGDPGRTVFIQKIEGCNA